MVASTVLQWGRGAYACKSAPGAGWGVVPAKDACKHTTTANTDITQPRSAAQAWCSANYSLATFTVPPCYLAH